MIASRLQRRGDNCPLPILARTAKARATGEARSKKNSVSISHRQPNSAVMDLTIARLRVRKTLRYTSQRGAVCSNPIVCYELVRIRRREGFQIDGEICRIGGSLSKLRGLGR